ncbi:MAG: exo-alpha-sialidase [Acidobacteria bacterium]|jgi:hypothetical protein|nr:exo-alpha-sialidase [Acidobacteriota bacterium]
MAIGRFLRAAFWPGVMFSAAIVFAQHAGLASAAMPWTHDVAVLTIDATGASRTVATFPRGGVSTLARLPNGRVVAAYQYFPEGRSHPDLDRIAVRFSDDEGETWSEARVIAPSGLPTELRSPFDPALVTLSDGRLRLYFTSMSARDGWPAIYSAISTNGLDYSVEPGVRFAVSNHAVIDSTVVLHQGQFHIIAPDGGRHVDQVWQQARATHTAGLAYHAVSDDGLRFTRLDDVVLAKRRWLGSAYSDGRQMTFFGTGDRGEVWTATSPDGHTWTPGPTIGPAGSDPGAVARQVTAGAAGWLLSVTTAPRDVASPIR